MKHCGQYEMLLRELCVNTKVKALLNYAKVENDIYREKFYRQHCRYPEPRDIADMVYFDLCEMLEEMAGEKLAKEE